MNSPPASLQWCGCCIQGHQQANGRVPHAQTNGRAVQPHHSSQRSNGGGAAQPRTTPSNPQPRAAAAPRAVAQPRQPLPQQAAAAGVNGAAHAPPVAGTLPASPRCPFCAAPCNRAGHLLVSKHHADIRACGTCVTGQFGTCSFSHGVCVGF